MDDRTWFGIDADPLTPFQEAFLVELRGCLGDRLRPYRAGATADPLLIVLDVDAADVALVTVGLRFDGNTLQGDRISTHDWTFPPSPTVDGFRSEGSPSKLARRGADLFEKFASRSIIRHEWLHRGHVYAHCYLFEDTGERLAQMYRSDWAPPGQEARLVDAGFVRGRGWIQTEGLGQPDRVVRVRA